MVLLKRNNKELKNDEGGLITSDEFMEALRQSRDLFREEKFIPLNLSLSEIIVSLFSFRITSLVSPASKSHKT